MSVLKKIAEVVGVGLYTAGIISASVAFSRYSMEFADETALDVASNRIVKLYVKPPISFPGQPEMTAVGTGFNIKASSGKIFTITNNHICDNSSDGIIGSVNEYGEKKDLAIVAQSDTDDLCLLEASSSDAYSLAASVKFREPVNSQGHPHGYPLSIERGRLMGTQTLDDTRMVEPGREKSCSHGGYQKQEQVPDIRAMFAFLANPSMPRPKEIPMMTLCHEHIADMLISSNRSFPGNSGSPLLNTYGEVIGVVFAIDDFGFTLTVPLAHVKALLDNY